MRLREDDQVNITGPAGKVSGTVEAILDPNALMLIEGVDVVEVQHALMSMRVDEMALISHKQHTPYGERRVLFAALHHAPDDAWYDVKRNRLEISAWTKS